MPIKTVIPRLRRVVEDAPAVGLADRGGHNLVERQIGELRAHDQFICVLDVRRVMLAMMKAQRLG
jgi:hypothetical protein